MKCPFCAEEIQDEAVLCRFCHARRSGEGWKPFEGSGHSGKLTGARGRSTLRLAGAFFLASAVLEMFSVTSDVVMAGAVRSGALAVTYHLVFMAVYASMGLGLWTLRSWGYAVTMAGTALYSIDRIWFLLDDAAVRAWVSLQLSGLSGFEGTEGIVDPEQIVGIARMLSLVFLACWWGFALYVHMKRGIFVTRG